MSAGDQTLVPCMSSQYPLLSHLSSLRGQSGNVENYKLMLGEELTASRRLKGSSHWVFGLPTKKAGQRVQTDWYHKTHGSTTT